MTGPVDDKMCRTCLDQLSLARTADEWETIEPAVFTTGLYEGCRCSWRRVHSIDRTMRMRICLRELKRCQQDRPNF